METARTARKRDFIMHDMYLKKVNVYKWSFIKKKKKKKSVIIPRLNTPKNNKTHPIYCTNLRPKATPNLSKIQTHTPHMTNEF